MEVHRFKAPAYGAAPSQTPRFCTGDCVWRRWAQRTDDAHDTPRARALRSYLIEVSGGCHCPRRRFEKGH
jgi:hypothetical protein